MVKKILITFVLVLFIFNINNIAFAQENPSIDLNQIEDFSKKLQESENYIPSFNIKDVVENYKETGSVGLTLKEGLASLGKFVLKEVVGNSKLLVELLILGILSSILQNIQNAFSENGIGKIAHYACFATITLLIIQSFILVVGIATSAIDKMLEFIAILIPPLIMLIASSGQAISAATLDPIVMLIITMGTTVIKNFVIPSTAFVVALNIVNSLSDEPKVQKLASLIKQISLWALGFIMTIFITLITIRTNTSANLDAVTLKTTKFFIDNFVPLVGKSLSDAITTVVGYSIVLKDALSLIGLVVMVFICLFPLLKIILISLIYKFVAAVMEPIVDKRITGCLTSIGGSLTVIFSSVLSMAIMFFIMITIITSTGKLILTVGG